MERTITIRVSDDMRKSLQTISNAEHIPLSDLVRESIRRTIALHQFRRLRHRVLPFAEAQGVLTDEDVFNRFS